MSFDPYLNDYEFLSLNMYSELFELCLFKPVISIQNDAINNTVTYCRISGASSSTTSGVINFLSTTGSLGNNNNTISN